MIFHPGPKRWVYLPRAVLIIAFVAGLLLLLGTDSLGTEMSVSQSGNSSTSSLTPGSGSPGTQSWRSPNSFSDEDIMQALMQAYPGVITKLEQRNGEWVFTVRGKEFFWAGGKLLSAAALAQAERYDRHSFYPYAKGYPEFRKLTSDQAQELRDFVLQRDRDPTTRHPGFFDTIWRIYDRVSSNERTKTMYFMGLSVSIHRDLMEDLASIEELLNEKRKTDPALDSYLKNLRQLEGYNYRSIANTESRSNHSYGIAIDILPKSLAGKASYWLWARQEGRAWYDIEPSGRHYPPLSFIEVFEEHGFIWGGKWFFYDTIHFEYRPEILILNQLRPSRLSGLRT